MEKNLKLKQQKLRMKEKDSLNLGSVNDVLPSLVKKKNEEKARKKGRI
jgi:hypothetical protein